MIDFTDYQRRAATIAIYSHRMRFAYLVPGTADEVFELLDTSAASDDERDEAGDVVWLAVMLRTEINAPMQITPFIGGCHLRDHLEAPARELLHRWTKIARDRRGIPNTDDKRLFEASTRRILQMVITLADRRGIAMADLLEGNLTKLAGRVERGTLEGGGTR